MKNKLVLISKSISFTSNRLTITYPVVERIKFFSAFQPLLSEPAQSLSTLQLPSHIASAPNP